MRKQALGERRRTNLLFRLRLHGLLYCNFDAFLLLILNIFNFTIFVLLHRLDLCLVGLGSLSGVVLVLDLAQVLVDHLLLEGRAVYGTNARLDGHEHCVDLPSVRHDLTLLQDRVRGEILVCAEQLTCDGTDDRLVAQQLQLLVAHDE